MIFWGVSFQTNFAIRRVFWREQMKEAVGLRRISWNFSLLAIFLRQLYWPRWALCIAMSWMDLSLSSNSMYRSNSCEYSLNYYFEVLFMSVGHFLWASIKIPFRLPWDQQTLRGWINETIFSVISSSLYLHTNVVFLTFFIAICEFHQAFSTYFIALLKLVQRCNGSKKAKPLLCYIIRYHVSIKR